MSSLVSWLRRHIFLIGGLVALLGAQLPYGALALSAIHKQYYGSAIALQAMTCEKLAKQLSRMASLGMEPARLSNLKEQLESHARLTQAQRLLVLNAEGTLLASWERPHDPAQALTTAQKAQETKPTFTAPPLPATTKLVYGEVREFKTGEKIWLIHPVSHRNNSLAGYVLLAMDESRLSSTLSNAMFSKLLLFGAITLGACTLFILLYFFLLAPKAATKHTQTIAFSKTRFYVSLLLPLLLSQFFFLMLLYGPLQELEESTMHNNATQLATQVGQDLEHIANLGLALDKVASLAPHLRTVQQPFDWVPGIALTHADGRFILAESSSASIGAEEWNNKHAATHAASVPVYNTRYGAVVAHVQVLRDPMAVQKNLLSIGLDIATMTVIAVLMLVELLTLFALKQERLRTHDPRPISASAQFIRPIIFLCLFTVMLSMSFIPLRMAQISSTFLGLPKEMLMGLPVSCEMFMVGLAILLGGGWSEKVGWRPLFLWGAVLVALGNFASGFVETPFPYIAARACAGAGYGLINLAGQVFVVAHSSSNDRCTNLAGMVAGLYAGLLCGSAFGGLIADRWGYATVFYVAAFFMLCIGILMLRILPKEHWETPEKKSHHLSFRELWRFFTDRSMASLLFLNIVPCAFLTVSLFQFYIPVSLHEGGASPASIGRVSMACGLVVVYLGPVFGRFADPSPRKGIWLAAGGALGALSLLSLFVFQGIWAAVLCVILLGLCNAIISNVQGAYALELPASQYIGSNRSIGIYNVMERLGQVLGPVMLGTFIALWGAGASIVGMAATLAGMSFVLLVLTTGSHWTSSKNRQ